MVLFRQSLSTLLTCRTECRESTLCHLAFVRLVPVQVTLTPAVVLRHKGGHKELDVRPLALVGKECELLLPLVVCTEADLTSQQVTSPSLRSR